MHISDQFQKALFFAYKAHLGQVRKYDNAPYIVHPIAVAELVRNLGGNVDMMVAALLHDVVEDCNVELFLIEKEFGRMVAQYVSFLTNASLLTDGNREVRKKIDREHIKKAPIEAKLIKLCDVWNNISDISKAPLGYQVKYLREKKMLLEEALFPLKDSSNQDWKDFYNSVLFRINENLRIYERQAA